MSERFERISDIRSIKPLITIAGFLGLSPHGFDQTRKCRPRTVHVLLLTSVIFFLSVGQLYRKGVTIYVYMEKSLTIVDAISTVCLLLINVVSIVGLNFWNGDDYAVFIATLLKVDHALGKYDVTKSKSERFYVQLAVLLGLFGTYLAYDGYFWISTGDVTYFWYRAVEVFQKCHLYVFFILIHSFITATQQRFMVINHVIERVVRKYLRDVKGNSSAAQSHMKTLSKLFINMSDNVGVFNAIYGWSILVSLAYIMSSILLWINYLISYVYVAGGEGQATLNWFQINLIATKVIWTVFTFTMNVILANSADSVVKQVRHTNLMCFKLAQEVQDVLPQEENLRQDLISLAQQASSRCPRFSAAGFFDIDYTMLFTLLNMFTSYLIVLIQFHK